MYIKYILKILTLKLNKNFITVKMCKSMSNRSINKNFITVKMCKSMSNRSMIIRYHLQLRK